MSGLFDSLTTATRSLAATRLGLDVAGQNIANINTPGYTRRTLRLSEVPPRDVLNAGGGVQVDGIRAARDQFIEGRLRAELQAGAYNDAVLNGLTEVEGAVGLPGQSIDGQLSAFFDAFKTLADDPSSVTARDGVVVQGRSLANAFHSMDDRFTAARRNADASVASAVGEVNRLSAEVARLNEAIAANGNEAESLRDQRDLALEQLSQIAGVTVTPTTDGSVSVSIGMGRALVVGASSYALSAVPSGSAGYNSVMVGGFDITAEVTTGQIAGLVHLRDVIVPGYQARLDQLAYDVSAQVNTLHQSGFDATGTAGGDFFSPLAGAAGAAAALTVDPGVAANSALVAASGTGAVGDNQTARAIAALRDARIANGGTATPSDSWAQLAYRVGTDVATARAESTSHEQVRTQIEQLRAQTSGVSMDEEAANLMRFQRAYEANARYFTTISDTLATLINLVR